jgi:hypothetical protein
MFYTNLSLINKLVHKSRKMLMKYMLNKGLYKKDKNWYLDKIKMHKQCIWLNWYKLYNLT